MITRRKTALGLGMATISGFGITLARPAAAASASALVDASNAALQNLYTLEPSSFALAQKAKGILVFPHIIKAGFMIGAETGDGAFYLNGVVNSYYNISAASYGFQAGVQDFSYALFFMNDAAVNYLAASDGWSVGAGPSVVVVDQSKAKSITSSTLTQDVYALPFAAQGLMAGMGIEGSKITHISPGP